MPPHLMLYPLMFEPRLVPKMWGGRKLESVLGKSLPPGAPIGESWEIYDFPPRVVDGSDDWVSSRIANGPLAGRTLHWLVQEFGGELLGHVKPWKHGQFPLLIKFLDAREDLSVQVHPDEAYAAANPHAHLKSEAWYVIQSDPGSRLLNGLRPGTTRAELYSAIQSGGVERMIAAVAGRPGDFHYLPSGTVHALGAGILVAEVQTPSDTTFRLYDFNRIDPSTGRPRALHVEQALQCVDFSQGSVPEPSNHRVTCDYFSISRESVAPSQKRLMPSGEPIIMIAVEGELILESSDPVSAIAVPRGQVALIPASLSRSVVRSDSGGTWLEVTFPQ